MPIKFRCEHCRQLMMVKDHMAGRIIECPKCHESTPVPHEELDTDLAPPAAEAPESDDEFQGDNYPVNEADNWESEEQESVTPEPPPRKKSSRKEQRESVSASRKSDSTPVARKRSPALLIIGGVVGCLLLVGAAFLAGQMAAGPAAPGQPKATNPVAAADPQSPETQQTASSGAAAREAGASSATTTPPAQPPATVAVAEADVNPKPENRPAVNTPAAPPATPANQSNPDTSVAQAPATPPTVSPATPSAPATVNLPALPPPAREPVAFTPLPLEEQATSYAMTEDGAYLVATHQAANRVSIYDVLHGKVVQTVAVEAPRSVLCRGDRVFIANFGHGKISILSRDENWALVNELQVDLPRIMTISAAGGEYFEEELLVTCHPEGSQGSYHGPVIFHVDVARDKCRKIGGESLATVSYDGNLVFTQGSFNLSPSGGISAYPYADYTTTHGKPIFQGGIQQTPFVYQVQAGGYWLAENMVFGGTPVNQVQKDVGNILVPDLAQKVVYSLTPNGIVAHQLNASFSEIEKRKAAFPADVQKQFDRVYHQVYRRRDYMLDHPVSCTVDSVLSLFVLDIKTGTILGARTTPFVTPPPRPTVVPQVAKTNPAGPGNSSSGATRPGTSAREAVAFASVSLDEPATSYALTEDGKFLIVTHQAAGRVSVYDVQQKKVVQSVAMEAPRSVICRGGRAFIANFGKGLISILSEEDGWVLTDELQVDHPRIMAVSAAGGQYFDEELIVTCHPEGVEGSYHGPLVYHVDVAHDKCRQIGADSLATVSYDGKLVMTQTSFRLSPGGGLGAFPYAEFVTQRGRPVFAGGISSTPYVYQTQAGGFWLAENMIFGGVPINQVQKDLGKVLIPDLAQKVIYSLTPNTIVAYQFGGNFQELAKRKTQFPADAVREFERIYHTAYRHRDYLLDHPVAFTQGEELVLFVLDMKSGTILEARTAPFATPEDRPQGRADSPRVAGSGTPSTPSASGGNSGTPIKRPTEGGLTGNLPQLIISGKPFKHQFPQQSGVSYELKEGPSGLSISPAGEVAWTPTPGQVGSHELKVRITGGGQPLFERPAIEVVDQDLADSVGGDLSKLDQFARLDLEVDHFSFRRSIDGESLLLLQGDTLQILGADGLTVSRKHTLPARYHDLRDRGEVFVALSKSPPLIEVFDKQTLKSKEKHPIEANGLRVMDVTDFTIHPTKPVSYIAIQSDVELPRFMVVTMDERTGKLGNPDIVGTYVEIDSTGRTLYTGYKDLYQSGSRFHLNPDWQIIEIPQYGSIDMLISWDLSRSPPKPKQLVRNAGGNGSGIRLSPDGQRITYLSHGGLPPLTGNLPGFKALNLDDPYVSYPVKERGSRQEVAFHPTLPWVASPAGKSIALFHRDTGKILEKKLLLTSQGLGNDSGERLMFSPDGQSLIVQCQGGETGRYLRRIALKLTPQELERTRQPISRPPEPKELPKIMVAAQEFDAIHAAQAKDALTPKEIGKRYMDAVVLVRTESSVGTGFVIGKNGYILTCAHVLPEGEKIDIVYQLTTDGKTQAVTTRAQLIRTDEKRDIALIKITPRSPLVTVLLPQDLPVETGEAITVIGNPGLGTEIVLTQTMTTGIVSNPAREIEGQMYLQTSAAVNPGNSGGPMFDSRGHVVGLVSLKGSIEAAGFAVPTPVLRNFLGGVIEEPAATKTKSAATKK